MKTLLALAAALTAAALASPLAPAYPSASVDTVDLSRPGSLERGDDVRIPHLEGTTLVDGDLRIDLDVEVAMLLGPSLEGYVVVTWDEDGSRWRLTRVESDGEQTVLHKGGAVGSSTLSADGTQVVTSRYARRHTTFRVYDAVDGTEQASRTFRGAGTVLDFSEQRMVIGSWDPGRTFWWNSSSDDTLLITRDPGYEADIAADRVAWYSGDPYDDGRSVVAQLSDPDILLWTSRHQRVYEFSPDGTHAATVHLLADGLGPSRVQLREVGGTLLVSYDANWFGLAKWEDDDTLLLEANGRRNAATVRCDGADCERASKLTPVINP